MICLTLSGSTLEENAGLVRSNRDYIDIAELRVDLLDEEEQKRARLFPAMTDVPVILTLRRKCDGGKCTLSERQRRSLLLDALDGDFAYVDIEEDIKRSEVEQKARERGVKIIGATSHYVTTELDAGPIIEQDVVRISHKDTPESLVLKGRDLEKIVLSRAVTKHIERKILTYNNKTIIFS